MSRNGKEEAGCDREDPDPSRAGNPATGRHRSARTGSTSWTSARRTTPRRRASVAHHPGRDLDLRGPVFTFRHQDPADLCSAGRRHREGRGEPAPTRRARSRGRRYARSPRRRCPTSMLSTSRVRCPGRGHRGRWESRSANSQERPSCPERVRQGVKAHHDKARQEVHRRDATLRPRRLYPATEALDLVKSLATRKFDETVAAAFRLGVDPRKVDQRSARCPRPRARARTARRRLRRG